MAYPSRFPLLAVMVALALAVAAWPCAAQTPSPLANWQYSAGEVLSSLEGPAPDWRATVGPGVNVQPSYAGAKRYDVGPGGIIDLRYRDIAFLSDGEGLGVNLLHGQGYRAGIAIGYDLGRGHHDDPRLTNLRNVSPAPEAKAFAQYFILPVVLAVDLRRGLGGHDGLIGDVGAYVPLPLGDQAFLFVGPTVGFADSRYMQAYFGVSSTDSRASGLARFTANGGLHDTGLGATAVWLLGDHWLLEADSAAQRLLGDAAHSPITETKVQFTGDVNVAYRF